MTTDVVKAIVSALSEGDRVTVAVTHQVQIDGNSSWIKIEVNSAVRHDEEEQDTFDRVGGVIADRVVAEIERQAAVILAANAAQRSRRNSN